jgi:predicted phage-related endonuclease
MLILHEKDFWMHVNDDVPLPADGSDAYVKFLNNRYPTGISKSFIQLPVNAEDLIFQHNEADEQLKLLKEQKQKAANTLKQMLGEHEIGFVGDGYAKWQNVTQERFDAKMLEEEQPDIYAKYVVKSSHRRFTLKEPTKFYENVNTRTQPILRKAG